MIIPAKKYAHFSKSDVFHICRTYSTAEAPLIFPQPVTREIRNAILKIPHKTRYPAAYFHYSRPVI